MGIRDALRCFWNLNDDILDATPAELNLVNASADGQPHFIAGKLGSAWQFTGTAGARRLLAAAAGVGDPAGGVLSVSVWIHGSAALNSLRTVLWYQSAGGASNWWIRYNSQTGAIAVSMTSGGASQTIGATIAAGWHHVAVVFAPGQPIALWIDGVAQSGASGSVAAWSDATQVLSVGAQYVGPGSYLSYLQADVDAIGLWSRALNQSDVDTLYSAGAGWEYTPPDATPDAFAFGSVVDAEPSAVVQSEPQVIAGIDPGTAVSVSGGEYRLNGGDWTTAAGTISEGDTLELRATSSAESEGVVETNVTVGTATVAWSITTAQIISIITNVFGGELGTTRILRSRIVQGVV